MNRNEFLEPLLLSRISLKLSGATLEICTDDIEDIHVMASGAEGDVKALRISVSGNQLLVEQPTVSLQKNPISTSWLQVTIRLPMSWKGRIDARTVTGWINVRCLNGTDLTLESVSGLINANALLFSDITLRTVTGDIRVGDMTCIKATLGTTSGAVRLQNTSLEQCSLTTVTSSMALALRAPFQSITASSVIGDLAIDAPISQCNAVCRSVAGRISTNGVSILETADCTVQFTTVSGSLDISQAEMTQ